MYASHQGVIASLARRTGWSLVTHDWDTAGYALHQVYETEWETVTLNYMVDRGVHGGGEYLAHIRHQEKGSAGYYSKNNYDPDSHELLGLASMWLSAGQPA